MRKGALVKWLWEKTGDQEFDTRYWFTLSSSKVVLKKKPGSVTRKKSPILTPIQKLPKNVGDLGKLIVAKDFKKLPKVN